MGVGKFYLPHGGHQFVSVVEVFYRSWLAQMEVVPLPENHLYKIIIFLNNCIQVLNIN